MSRLVLRGARWPGDVAVEDGRIVAVGSVPEEPGDEVVRVDGDLITAGLVNTHHHFYQWMTRGRAVGRDDIGRLAPGLRADLVVWPGDDLGDVPDPLAGLVLGPDRRARHVLVDGQPVVRDGELLGADAGQLRRELARRARRVWPE